MTDPQRRKMVMSGAAAVTLFLIVYLVLFGAQALDLKAFAIMVGFFAAAWKISSQKHRRNPLV